MPAIPVRLPLPPSRDLPHDKRGLAQLAACMCLPQTSLCLRTADSTLCRRPTDVPSSSPVSCCLTGLPWRLTPRPVALRTRMRNPWRTEFSFNEPDTRRAERRRAGGRRLLLRLLPRPPRGARWVIGFISGVDGPLYCPSEPVAAGSSEYVAQLFKGDFCVRVPMVFHHPQQPAG